MIEFIIAFVLTWTGATMTVDADVTVSEVVRTANHVMLLQDDINLQGTSWALHRGIGYVPSYGGICGLAGPRVVELWVGCSHPVGAIYHEAGHLADWQDDGRSNGSTVPGLSIEHAADYWAVLTAFDSGQEAFSDTWHYAKIRKLSD